MPFTFKLHEPPCDVAFLSIVDGETLYNADNVRARDVKEATIRQIGWHRVVLPQEWFLSAKALETTSHVLMAMQCTVQYLKHCCKGEEKRGAKLTAALQRCEEERAAAFEELIELRETVALYKKKLREVGQIMERGAAEAGGVGYVSPTSSSSVLTHTDGLHCAFCANAYPSRHALESHLRKRHKRPAGYAAMAAASAAVEQKQRQQTHDSEPLQAHSASNLPFMSSPPLPSPRQAVSDTRGDRSLREELSELRLTIARLLTQQAELHYGMSPSCTAAVPMTSAAAAATATPEHADRSAPPVVARTAPAAGAGALPGLQSTLHDASETTDSVVLRIPRELLCSNAALSVLQKALEGETRSVAASTTGDGMHHTDENKRQSAAGRQVSSPPPHETAPPLRIARPTLDPRSFARSTASDSVNGGAGGGSSGVAGAEVNQGSTMNSFVEVSPMSPTPSMAAERAKLTMGDKRGKQGEQDQHSAVAPAGTTGCGGGGGGLDAGGWGVLANATRAGRRDDTGAPRASLETWGPVRKAARAQADASLVSSWHALTLPSEYGSLRDDLTASSIGQPRIGNAMRTPGSSTPNSALANRYGPPPPDSSEEASKATSRSTSGSPHDTQKAHNFTTAAPAVKPPPAATPSGKSPPMSGSATHIISDSFLSKKNYGPVPSVPILREESTSTVSLPTTSAQNIQPALQPPPPASLAVRARPDDAERLSPDAASLHGRVRSPTQAPHHGNTPPTSRVTQVPTLDLGSVSLHDRAEQPQRSASPFVGSRSHHHQQQSTGDAIVHATLNSSSSEVRQSSFTLATQAPTQKTIPVVRLVPAAPSTSVELAEEVSEGGNDASAPSFTKADVCSQSAHRRTDNGQTSRDQRNQSVDEASDASYSVEPQRRTTSDTEKREEDEEDALNTGMYKVCTGDSSADLHDDIAVDRASSSSSSASLLQQSDVESADADPIMEDVLTDNVAQPPLFGSPLSAYRASARQSASTSVSENADRREKNTDENRADDDSDEAYVHRHQQSAPGPPLGQTVQNVLEEGSNDSSSGQQQQQEQGKGEDEQSVSSDYSYYTYSYSSDEEEEGEEGAKAGDESDIEGSQLSLNAPRVSPPMSVSLTAVSGPPAHRGTLNSTSDTHAKKRNKKNKQRQGRQCARNGAADDSEDHTEASTGVVFGVQEGLHASSQMPRVLSTEMTSSEEIASVTQKHDSSFQSNVSHTIKKASGVFKNIFGKKRKK